MNELTVVVSRIYFSNQRNKSRGISKGNVCSFLTSLQSTLDAASIIGVVQQHQQLTVIVIETERNQKDIKYCSLIRDQIKTLYGNALSMSSRTHIKQGCSE